MKLTYATYYTLKKDNETRNAVINLAKAVKIVVFFI